MASQYPPIYYNNGPPQPGFTVNINETGHQEYGGYGWPQPQQPSTIINVTENPAPQTVIVTGSGGCPSCQNGILRSEFTCLGICLAVAFFPIGLICLFCLTKDRCVACGAVYSN